MIGKLTYTDVVVILVVWIIACLLIGCESEHESLHRFVNEECPRVCRSETTHWDGTITVGTEKLRCNCE